jgi:uncharacterized metal-binding protein
MACGCSSADGKTVLLYSCSGAANTGYLADQVTRALAKEGVGKMTCLSAMGAGLSGFLESARGADRNVVIDGCPVGCGKKTFENAGIPFDQFVMTRYGVEKGKTPITGDVIMETVVSVKEGVRAVT